MKHSLQNALTRKGYTTLTPVQEAVCAPELSGRDLLVSAQTGSGKTIGFGLAIAPSVLGQAESFDAAGAPLALIIAPTRELAMQVKRELGWLYADTGAFIASCVGGMDMRDERRALARGAHMVVATPGRLRDHIMRGSIDLGAVRSVVLDEADEMLDLGFREDLEFILEETPSDRQTLLFSATVPRAIANLATQYQRDAERISTMGAQTQHADIDYKAMTVAPRDGENAIINALRYYEAPNAIVFCNTRAMVSRLTARLSNRGFSVVALSGELTQSERSNALQAMRDGRARVCVATDVAARGIDLPNLDLVVHAELPSSHETLLHRSGRTGRAGRKGVSALIVPPSARKKAERILKFARLSANWGPAPSAEAVTERDRTRMLGAEDWQAEPTASEGAWIADLLATFTPEQIAAAYVRGYKRQHTAPEDLQDITSAAPKPRPAFGPSVWFTLAGGRAANASPRSLLPMLCKAGGLSKEDIGAIRLSDEVTYIEIRKPSVAGFLQAIGPQMSVEGAQLVQLKNAPDLPKSAPGPRKRPGAPPKGRPARGKPKPSPVETGAVSPKRTSKGPAKGPEKGPAKGATKRSGPKGPPPPKGKPSSKKNRARVAAAKAAKAGLKRAPKN